MSTNSNNIATATKWSAITEISAKLVSPITNMILARLLTPEAFGVVATVTMVFSFADMITDSGFQKYLVQHEFASTDERERSTNVAFWTNLVLSFLFWGVISIFSDQIAVFVGNPGLGIIIIVACMSLPLTSFSSIQVALYRRDFDFKTLFFVRMVAVAIPLIVTVPLAFFTHSYWTLIIGTICGNLTNAIILTIRSAWKPRLYYSFKILKEMFTFSMWSLIETILIWLTYYICIFIVGKYLSSYYLGLYQISMNTSNQIMNLVTSATTAVLFSALSRAQNDREDFEKTFFKFHQKVSLLILPMGVGMFFYRDSVTQILLGSQWAEAAGFLGLWSLVNAFKILLSNYCSEAYRAMGKPKVSVVIQTIQLVFLVPMLLYGASKSFELLYIMRCLVSIVLIVINLIMITFTIRIKAYKMLVNIFPGIIAAGFMGVIAIGLQQVSNHIIWSFISIIICALVYFAFILILSKNRRNSLSVVAGAYNEAKNKYKKLISKHA